MSVDLDKVYTMYNTEHGLNPIPRGDLSKIETSIMEVDVGEIYSNAFLKPLFMVAVIDKTSDNISSVFYLFRWKEDAENFCEAVVAIMRKP